MMKNLNRRHFYSSLALLTCMMLLSSCEEVIDIDLDDVPSQLVIEANLTDEGTPCTVKISKTMDFQDATQFLGVSGAIVILTDNAGNTDTLAMTTDGIYQSQNIMGVSGTTYSLSVSVEGNTYTASSTMPQEVPMDTLETYYGFGTNLVVPVYEDPADVSNFYHFNLFVNGEKDATIFVQDDELSDGNQISTPLFGGEDELETGDTITVEMQSIDAAVYLFYYSLSQNQGGPNGAAAPANPVSNFTGGCLGYFSAYTTNQDTIVIP